MSYLIRLDTDIFVGDFIYREWPFAQIKFRNDAPANEATNFSKKMAESWLFEIKKKHPNAKIIPRKQIKSLWFN